MLRFIRCLCVTALCACGLLASVTGVFAQSKVTITGVVTDNLGPVPGVGVMVAKTANGTVTDLDGRYSIQAREGDVLVFSCVGYADLQRIVGKQTVIDVNARELRPDRLNEQRGDDGRIDSARKREQDLFRADLRLKRGQLLFDKRFG